MENESKIIDVRKVKCPICEKQFKPAVEHIYKVRIDKSGYKLACSYTCVRRWEREREMQRKAKKRSI